MTSVETAFVRDDKAGRIVLYLLVALLVTSFLLGGASRADVQSLALLRPLSAIALIVALFLALRPAWAKQWQPVAMMLAVILLTAAHLVPLPPSIWQDLPGRQSVVDVFTAAGQPLPPLPISLAPLTTWNALFALMGPAAALLLALAVPDRQLPFLLKIVLAIGAVSALLGLLQSIGPANGSLYFYRITNNGTAVGLFSNRNHQAIFLAALFPMLAAFASIADGQRNNVRASRVLSAAMGAFLVPLLLVTGSRAGLLLGVVGLFACFWVYRPAASERKTAAPVAGKRWMMATMVAGLALLGLTTILAARAPAFQRLIEMGTGEDMRFRALPTIWDAVWSYFPVGSGIGSFVEAYNIVEPQALLSPNYLNHAHNDVLEAALVGGVPSILLMLLFAFFVILAAWRLARVTLSKKRSGHNQRDRAIIVGRAGLVAMIILAIGSIADYPLRTPSLAVVMMVFAAFVAAGWRAASLPTQAA